MALAFGPFSLPRSATRYARSSSPSIRARCSSADAPASDAAIRLRTIPM